MSDRPPSKAEVYDILEGLDVAGRGPVGVTKAVWKFGKVVDVVPYPWVMDLVEIIWRKANG